MSASAAPAACAVERAAQQLDADLKFPLAGPTADEVECVLVVAGPREHLPEIGGQRGAVRQRCKKPFRQHQIEERRALRQQLRQSRGARHDFGNQRKKTRIGMEQGEQRHAGREARQELVKVPKRRIRMARFAKNPQQFGYELSQDLARSLAARRGHPAVVPAADQGGDCGRLAKAELRPVRSVRDRRRRR